MPFVAGSPGTLSQALQGAAVDVATLQRRYGAQLAIGRKVLGVVPTMSRESPGGACRRATLAALLM